MTDGELLFLILCLVYLTDCVHWLSPGTIVFVKWIGKAWRHKTGLLYFGISDINFLLANPLPPLGLMTCSYPSPVSVSPDGIVLCDALVDSNHAGQESVSLRFEDIDSVLPKDKEVLINGNHFCKCPTEQEATALSNLLQSLKSLKPGERESAISFFWEKQFDYSAAKRRMDSANEQIRDLKSMCVVLFFYLFVIAPVCCALFGVSNALLPVAVPLIPFAIIINRGFYAAHKTLYPELSFERLTELVKNSLCPPALIRACDHITKDALQGYHPVVAGHILLETEEFRFFASETVRKMKTPLLQDALDDLGLKIMDWHTQKLLSLIFDYLRNIAGIDSQLVLTPARRDPDANAYCPRCLCQFVQADGNCPDCAGVKLDLFDKPLIRG